MRPAAQQAYARLAKVLDKADLDCQAVAAKQKAGERLTVAETVLLNDWQKEMGGKPWRSNRKIVLKLKRAARKAARNKRGKDQ